MKMNGDGKVALRRASSRIVATNISPPYAYGCRLLDFCTE
jgi:hypothetical protein